MRTLIFLSVLLTLLVSCKPDEEIITGDIAGTLRLYDQYGIPVYDMQVIPVSLKGNDGFLATVNTDEIGQFVFEDIPYGKYTITAGKEGYHFSSGGIIRHLGGYGATYTQGSLHEIPTLQLELDSIAYVGFEKLSVYLKLDGDTLLPPAIYGIYIIVFASNSPDLNKDQYESMALGNLTNRHPDDNQQIIRVYARILTYNFRIPIDQLSADRIYFRFYPIAWGAFYGYEFDPAALGKPSNVFSFDWDEVVIE